MTERKLWLKELRLAEQHARTLVREENPPKLPSEREQCVICDKRTTTWLHPENAPLCGEDCLRLYLGDPSIYDPRELHSKSSRPLSISTEGAPVITVDKTAPKIKRRRKPGRWEPSEKDIAEMQARIRQRRRPDD